MTFRRSACPPVSFWPQPGTIELAAAARTGSGLCHGGAGAQSVVRSIGILLLMNPGISKISPFSWEWS